MEDKPTLNLFFFSTSKEIRKIMSYKLSFDNIIHKLDSDVANYEIPENIFKYGKEKTRIFIELYGTSNQLLSKIQFPVNYYENNVYLQIDGDGNGSNFEMVFSNAKGLNVKAKEKEFNAFDSCGIADMKKITILNCDFDSIMVKDQKIQLEKYFIRYPSKFLLFSINLKDYKVIVQPFEEVKQPEIHLLMKQKLIFEKFYRDLVSLLKQDLEYKNQYTLIIKKYMNIESFYLGLNLSSKYLEEYFKDNNIRLNDTFFYYTIYCQFYHGYSIYMEDKPLFQKIVDKTITFFNKIYNEENFNEYDKILLFSKVARILFLCEDIDSLNKINIEYFIVSNCEKNSIIYKAIEFYNIYVDLISEQSRVFPYLLNLDSGTGYYDNDIVYTFDMISLKMIKYHLKEICPKFLVFYYQKNDTLANSNKSIPCISINLYNLLKEYSSKKIILDKTMKNKGDTVDDLAMNLFILLFHECMGHKKFAYNKNKKKSPKKIINQNNDLIELRRRCEFKVDDGQDYILGDNCKNRGDSGSFLGLAYGKFRKDLIMDLMLTIKGKGSLIKRPDLFTGSNNDILRKYIILKLIAKEKNISINKKGTIEEEIQEFEKFINYEKIINEPTLSINKESKYIGKKIKRENDKDNDNDIDTESYLKEKNKKIKNDMNFENMNILFSQENPGTKEKDEFSYDDNFDLSEYSDCHNIDELFDKLYPKIVKKYGFKNDEIQEISDRLKDNSLTIKEKWELNFALYYMDEVI